VNIIQARGGNDMQPMTRIQRLTALPMALALITIGLSAATARAVPSPDPAPGGSCAYDLTAPSHVNVSGTDMVTATITPGACTGVIQPNSFSVCVGLLGEGRPQCKFSPVYDPVQVYFMPYRKGATYQSTGQGCGNVFPSADQTCSSLGPYTATL
jgi:disulfide bond formation protein DsbB